MLDSINGATLERLKVFYTVLQYGSFSKAAYVLHVSTSSVSRQIKQLEESFGLSVIERLATGIKPTAEGLKLFDKAEALLTAFETIMDGLHPEKSFSKPVTGRVGILTTPVGAHKVLDDALPFIHSIYPGITFEVKQTYGIKDAMGELMAHAWHFFIASDYHLLRSLSFIPLFSTETCLIAPKGYVLPENVAEDMSCITRIPLIGLSETLASSSFLRSECEKMGIDLCYLHSASSLSLQMAMVRGGLGCALIDRSWLDGGPGGLYEIIPMKAFPKRRFGIVQRKGVCQPRHVAAVIDIIGKRFSDNSNSEATLANIKMPSGK